MTFRVIDPAGRERDFFFEMQKHSCHLRQEFFARQLGVYELYRRTMQLPGSIAEFGVRNGANYFFLARLIETFHGAQRHDGIAARHLFGFDTFSGFPSIAPEDQADTAWHDMGVGGVPTDRDVFFTDFARFRESSPIASRLHVVEGDVMQTLPAFRERWPGVRFSLVYLDLDLYEPTLAVLEQLWDRIVPGGVVVFDEYGLPEFPGESRAVDEFLQGRGQRLETLPWCYCPTAFTIKQSGRSNRTGQPADGQHRE